jgi:hypothetical protein
MVLRRCLIFSHSLMSRSCSQLSCSRSTISCSRSCLLCSCSRAQSASARSTSSCSRSCLLCSCSPRLSKRAISSGSTVAASPSNSGCCGLAPVVFERNGYGVTQHYYHHRCHHKGMVVVLQTITICRQ